MGTEKLLTHTGPLSERHEGAENAVNVLRSVLNGEASLQLQSSFIVHHPADGIKLSIWSVRRVMAALSKQWAGKQTHLYSSSLLTQALTSREGSLASRLIQDRADMLQMELPSLTTSRLALVSFPEGMGAEIRGERGADQLRSLSLFKEQLIRIRNAVSGQLEMLRPLPVAMSKRKENMLPLSSPAHRILPGASKERDSTRPVSLLEPPFTFFPVEMFTTCRWCLLFPT